MTQMGFDHENEKEKMNQKHLKETKKAENDKKILINEYEQKLLLLEKSKENELAQLNQHFENELKKIKE